MGRFEQIYEEHREALRVFVQRRAPESVVDDVVSETFLVCWRKLNRIPDEPLPWLYAVARKTLANQRRRLAREQRVGAADPASAVAELEPVGDTVLAGPSRRSRSAIGKCCGSLLGRDCRSARRRSSSAVRRLPAASATTARRRGWRDGSMRLRRFDQT